MRAYELKNVTPLFHLVYVHQIKIIFLNLHFSFHTCAMVDEKPSNNRTMTFTVFYIFDSWSASNIWESRAKPFLWYTNHTVTSKPRTIIDCIIVIHILPITVVVFHWRFNPSVINPQRIPTDFMPGCFLWYTNHTVTSNPVPFLLL